MCTAQPQCSENADCAMPPVARHTSEPKPSALMVHALCAGCNAIRDTAVALGRSPADHSGVQAACCAQPCVCAAGETAAICLHISGRVCTFPHIHASAGRSYLARTRFWMILQGKPPQPQYRPPFHSFKAHAHGSPACRGGGTHPAGAHTHTPARMHSHFTRAQPRTHTHAC